MSFRTIAMNCGGATALALALTLATPAVAADELPADAPAYRPGNDMPLPAAPDMRPEWRPEMRAPATNAALLPDSRTRDAWLNECRRRTAYYYDDGGRHHHRRHRDDRGHRQGYAPGGYDYCEAYFDDYYRTYTQPGYAYAYPAMVTMRPVAMAPVTSYQTSQPQVSEVVTERYEPLRSRVIQHRRARRVIRDKRIRVAP